MSQINTQQKPNMQVQVAKPAQLPAVKQFKVSLAGPRKGPPTREDGMVKPRINIPFMMSYEIVEFLNSQPDERTKHLAMVEVKNHNQAFTKLLKNFLSSTKYWYPTTIPPFKTGRHPEGMAFTNIFREFRRMEYLTEESVIKLGTIKAQSLLITILESIETKDIPIFIAMLKKDLTIFPFTIEELQAIYPALFTEVKYT